MDLKLDLASCCVSDPTLNLIYLQHFGDSLDTCVLEDTDDTIGMNITSDIGNAGVDNNMDGNKDIGTGSEVDISYLRDRILEIGWAPTL